MATPGVRTLTTLTGGEYVTAIDAGGAVIAQASTAAIAQLWSSGAQINASYTASTITGGATVTLSNNRTSTFFHLTQASAGTVTVNMPPAPVNGQVAVVSFDNTVTTVSFTASGITVSAAPTAVTVTGSVYGWTYDTPASTWYRSV